MNTTVTIDEWDNQLIAFFKSNNVITLDKIKKIWGKRCGLDLDYVQTKDINEHLLLLAKNLGLFENDYVFKEFIFNLNITENWRFMYNNLKYLNKNTSEFDLILLSRLSSLFALTKVIDLPGYSG